MSWHDKDHPVWKLADKALIVGIVGGVIYWNSSSFDKGELTSIVTILIGAFARDKLMKS